MSKQDTGGPAFPIPGYNQPEGMTLRDYFAAKAIHAMGQAIAEAEVKDQDLAIKAIAVLSYQMADAMLEARKGGA